MVYSSIWCAQFKLSRHSPPFVGDSPAKYQIQMVHFEITHPQRDNTTSFNESWLKTTLRPRNGPLLSSLEGMGRIGADTGIKLEPVNNSTNIHV